MKSKKNIHYFLIFILLIISPLAGVILIGQPIAPYLEFPPLTRYVVHAPFNLFIFTGLFIFEVVIFTVLIHRIFSVTSAPQFGDAVKHQFPWWGWLGCVINILTWILAWNRFPFFDGLQRYTFFPLWVGYILVINGLTVKRRGDCPLTRHTSSFLWLFPTSALFWWYFEYLNRFVQNWYYPGTEDISRLEYIIHASICFSTVLPAIFSTYIYLRTYPRVLVPFKEWHPIRLSTARGLGGALIGGSILILSLLVVFSDYLFPFVWISPLFLIVAIQLLAGKQTIFYRLEKGDWQYLVLPALAALICGFFWEMWNWKSLARWEYSIPFVHKFEIFEMPLLGYAGYLPFGLECIAVITLLFPVLGSEIDGSKDISEQNPPSDAFTAAK